jgi:endonuclease/exonuclease/phosphatase family metal-dependent hydrolase
LDYPFVAYAPVFDWSMMDANVAYGNAILSKYPITEQHTEFVSGKYIAGFHFAYDNHNSARNFVHATITDEREIYQILTHHGYYHPDSKRGDDSSQRQMEQLGEYLDTLSGSIILTGDFNLEPDTVSLAEINHRLRNLTVEFQAPTTRNLLAKRKTEIIDYIFVSDNIKVKSFRVADEIVSDHQALILEI